MKIRSIKNRQNRKAFSLLELVAVVTLIGIVAAVTMTRLNNVDKAGAADKVDAQNVALIQSAIERYKFDTGQNPSDVATLVSGGFLAKAPTSPTANRTYSISNGIASHSN